MRRLHEEGDRLSDDALLAFADFDGVDVVHLARERGPRHGVGPERYIDLKNDRICYSELKNNRKLRLATEFCKK